MIRQNCIAANRLNSFQRRVKYRVTVSYLGEAATTPYAFLFKLPISIRQYSVGSIKPPAQARIEQGFVFP